VVLLALRATVAYDEGMQIRSLVLVVAVGGAGFCAGRVGRSEAQPVPAAPMCVAQPPPLVVREVPISSDDAVEGDGEDIGELLARVETEHAEPPPPPPPRQGSAISGRVVDERDLPLAGVTVIATSPAIEHAQTAITDEHGTWKIAELPTGTYDVTYYYNDITTETFVGVSALNDTEISEHMTLEPHFEAADTYENTYIVDDPETGAVGAISEPAVM
jgi:hypothetical protein